MTEVGIATLIIIITNIFCFLQGSNDRQAFKRNNLHLKSIRENSDYSRLLTAGFFHANFVQLLANMITLYLFMGAVGSSLGEAKCLVIYFASLLVGNLFAILLFRFYDEYSAVAGSSGAVSGVVFAALILLPGFKIGIWGRDLMIPAWLYATGYLLFSIYGVRSKRENIGYEIQLAGGLCGLLLAIIIRPSLLQSHYEPLLWLTLMAVPALVIIVCKPQVLLVDNKFFYEQKRRYAIENILGVPDMDREQEIDLILEKIHQQGMRSLSKAEKEKLDHYSRIIQ